MTHTTKMGNLLRFTITMLGCFIMLYPLLWMFSSSIKPESTIFTQMGLWPSQVTFENYVKGWQGVSGITFSSYLINSFAVVILCIIGNLISCSLTAYAFARMDFSLKKLLFALMLGTLMLPQHAVLIPQYVLFSNFNWINTILPLTIPKFFATDAFFIYLMIQFMRGIPAELDQAANIDGCGRGKIFIKVILPLSTPALVTTTIFTFIWTWNDFFSQLIYISNPKLYTVSLGLRVFMDAASQSAFGSLFAMSIVCLVPIIILFICFQRLLVEGIATSGLKG